MYAICIFELMPQLSDLIQAGRSAGKTDDVIWKELSSQGWADADISRVLGESESVAPTEVSPLPISTGGAVTGGISTFIGGLLLVLLLGGVGAYVVFSRTQEPAQGGVSEASPTASVASTKSRGFRCVDAVTDAVFMSAVGVSATSYELDERKESYGDEQSYYCDYTLKNPPQGGEYAEVVSLVVNEYPSGYSSIEEVFALLSQKSPESFMLSSNRQYIVSFLVATNSPALRSTIIAQLKQSIDAYLSR